MIFRIGAASLVDAGARLNVPVADETLRKDVWGSEQLSITVILRACDPISCERHSAELGDGDGRRSQSLVGFGQAAWARSLCPARTLLARANQRSTVSTFSCPRTVNWRRPQLRKRALMHSPGARRL